MNKAAAKHVNTGAGTASPGLDEHYRQYTGVGLTVHLDHAAPVGAALNAALHGWRADFVAQPDASIALSRVDHWSDGFRAHSVYLSEPIHGLGVAGAACAVIADLAQDYFETRPGCLALHCAAFRYNNRLIAMTGPSRAGKSTLAARLTLEPDCEVFCDDVLPMPTDGQAIGLGIAPRLRLPLPKTASHAFKAHVARYIGPRDDRYGYLCAPTVAPHGTRASLSVLLILDRRDAATARLHAVADDEALHFLLSQNMSDLNTPQAAFDRLSDLLSGITCLRLVYSDLEDAVALIRRAFGTTAPLAADVEIGPILLEATHARHPQADLPPDICWSRNPEVVIQQKADGALLWQPGRQMIWHMNALALAVWTLLEIPGSATDLATPLHDHFPDQTKDDLIHDVNTLLQALSQDGLIERTAHPLQS